MTNEPVLSAVGRLALLHLREGVGFAVDWREFPDEAGLLAAFAAGRVDIAVGVTDTGRLSSSPPSSGCTRDSLAPLAEALRKRWSGEVYLLGFDVATAACSRPALIVSRAVLADLRFGILGKESARLATFITRDDVEAVRGAAQRGGERAATAAARTVLATRTGR